MRKTLLALSALAAVAITASAASRTEASPLVNPAGLADAVDELALVDNVHCRPGRRHHYPNRWRRADGCRRYYRGGVIVVPGRTRYVIRDGVRVRVRDSGARTTIRSGSESTTIRSRTNINVREGGGGGTQSTTSGGTQSTTGGAVQGGTTQGGAQKSGTQKGSTQKGSGGTQKGTGTGTGTQN